MEEIYRAISSWQQNMTRQWWIGAECHNSSRGLLLDHCNGLDTVFWRSTVTMIDLCINCTEEWFGYIKDREKRNSELRSVKRSGKRSKSLLKPQCQWRYCQDLFCFTTGRFAHRGVAFKFSWNSIKLKVPSFQQRCHGSNGSGLATRPPSVPIWFVPQLSWIGY